MAAKRVSLDTLIYAIDKDDEKKQITVILPSTHTVEHALKSVEEHSLSFGDAILWSVAHENGVSEIYSEDFQAGRELKGVLFCNPFV